VNAEREHFADTVEEITAGKGANAVLELVGTEATLPKSFACLATAGTLIIVGFQPGAVFATDPTRFVTDEIAVIGSRYVNYAELAEAADWVGAGRVKPVISQTYPLAEAEDALADLAANRIMGRAPIVLDT
jgi:D-arabinose 1-dehydrogenase-like Zn-dependent alcohol dehydrogenase